MKIPERFKLWFLERCWLDDLADNIKVWIRENVEYARERFGMLFRFRECVDRLKNDMEDVERGVDELKRLVYDETMKENAR